MVGPHSEMVVIKPEWARPPPALLATKARIGFIGGHQSVQLSAPGSYAPVRWLEKALKAANPPEKNNRPTVFSAARNSDRIFFNVLATANNRANELRQKNNWFIKRQY